MKTTEPAAKAHKRVVKAKYTSHACNQCRKSKTRCDGKEPICARCERMGHECNWGAEDARKAITRHHEQSLRNRIKVLETHIATLQAQLVAQGQVPQVLPTSYATSPSDDNAIDGGGHGVSGVGQSSMSGGGVSVGDSDGEHSDPNEPANGEVDALVAPTKNLYLENDEIHLYGLTSVFRLANQHKQESDLAQQRQRGNSPMVLQRKSLSPGSGSAENPDARVDAEVDENSMLDNNMMDYNTDKRKHVLLIPRKMQDGSTKTPKPHCECWSNCWSRYLPHHHEIPMEREEHDRLLDIFFKFFNHWSMRVIPSLFLRDMYRVLHTPFPLRRNRNQATSSASINFTIRTAHYSPLLHNAILAIASVFSDPKPQIGMGPINPANLVSTNPSSSKVGSVGSTTQLARHRAQTFATRAKSFIEPECEQPSVSALVGLSLLASFHSGESQQSLGFMYCGMSLRLSHALGLRCDCSEWVKRGLISATDQFDRNWCFHVMCSQDACWSLYVGREFGTPTPAADQNIPKGEEELGLDLESWNDDVLEDENELGVVSVNGTPGKEREKRESTHIFPTFMASCDLMRICRRILDVVLALTEKNQTQHAHLIATEVDIQLTAWKDNLPPELKLTASTQQTAPPHKLMLHLAYWWLLILLHRPFYRKRSGCNVNSMGEPFSVTRCNQAAKEILSLLRSHRTQYTLRYVPITLIQATFAAGTIYLLSAISTDKGSRTRPAPVTRSTALAALAELVEMLMEVGLSWDCAKQFADIFRYFLTLQNRGGMGEESEPSASENDSSLVTTPADGKDMDRQDGAGANTGTNGCVDVWPLPREQQNSSLASTGAGGSSSKPDGRSVDTQNDAFSFSLLPPVNAGLQQTPKQPEGFNPVTPLFPSDGAWGFFSGMQSQNRTQISPFPTTQSHTQHQGSSSTAHPSNAGSLSSSLFSLPPDNTFQMLTDNDVVTKYNTGMTLDMMDMMMVDGGSTTGATAASVFRTAPGLSLGPHTFVTEQEMMPQGMQWSNEDYALFNMLTQQGPG